METITKPVLTIDVPNEKGVLFPLAVVQNAVAKAQHKKFVCKMMMPTSLEFGHSTMIDASHVVESLYILDGTLFAELRILSTEYGKMLSQMLEKMDVIFAAAGTALAEQREDGILEVTDYTIIGVHVKR